MPDLRSLVLLGAARLKVKIEEAEKKVQRTRMALENTQRLRDEAGTELAQMQAALLVAEERRG
jgi:hypothetical protein